MHTFDFDYELPSNLIAQSPLPDRDDCRLLRLPRRDGPLSHHRFADLPNLLKRGDLLVLNDSRVIPARLQGRKETGGRVETLLVRKVSSDSWLALTRPGLAVGQHVVFSDLLAARVEALDVDGQRLLRFSLCDSDLDAAIHKLGVMPIPPYIKTQLRNPDDYQTVYARHEGSVAAPTAGLHFTPRLLDDLRSADIDVAFLTLHVGIGTFRPVKVDEVSQHVMHAESFNLGIDTADAINRARSEGRRVVAVGTTVVRVLETVAVAYGHVEPGSGETSAFIRPGHTFRTVDGLITNFHLPRSTLLMLVSALAGRERVLAAYHEAIEREYRFFSFGDAMLID